MDFWSERFWLPQNVSWSDLQSTETVRYPEFKDLGCSILAGIALLFLRLFIECFVFLPFGVASGWVDTQKSSLSHRIYAHLTATGKSKFKRVSETAWRFTFYTSIWIAGYFVLRNEPQFHDVDDCWRNWPYHPLGDSVWWYYIIETGFYWSLLISTFLFDVRRSDFWQMMLHHGVTIVLLSLSFTVNYVRMGTLILFVHDSADILLELGKLFRYAGWDLPLNVVFVAFFIVWVVTRLIYFPIWIIHSVFVTAPEMIQKDFKWLHVLQRPIVPRVFLAMLIILLILHVFWTYLLVKIAWKSSRGGNVDDIREDSDFSDSEEVEKKRE
jgi:hypothetical protein